MHLGRFHAVVDQLERHFRTGKLPEQLDAAAAALDQFTQSRTESHIADFRAKLAAALDATEKVAPELHQPYAQQVIGELQLRSLLPPEPRNTITAIVTQHGFDSAALSAAIKEQSKIYRTQINSLKQLDSSLGDLSAEYTAVESGRAEVGLLLPREAVGEKLPDLSKEFDRLSNLVRAVNELTGEAEYDPKVLTISSSWWQVFLDVPVEQVVLWTLVVERIVALFKSNLEIKHLQKQLSEYNLAEKILKGISDEVERKVSAELKRIAADVVERFGRIDDKGRRNEVETQLRQGLHYLARRMNEGAQVEINVGVPDEPDDPETADGAEPDIELLEANAKLRERIAHLRALRASAMTASENSLHIERDAPLLLEDTRPSPDDRGDA
jgi:hypothetical protein